MLSQVIHHGQHYWLISVTARLEKTDGPDSEEKYKVFFIATLVEGSTRGVEKLKLIPIGEAKPVFCQTSFQESEWMMGVMRGEA